MRSIECAYQQYPLLQQYQQGQHPLLQQYQVHGTTVTSSTGSLLLYLLILCQEFFFKSETLPLTRVPVNGYPDTIPQSLRIHFLYIKFFGCVVNLERSSHVTKKALSCRYAYACIPGRFFQEWQYCYYYWSYIESTINIIKILVPGQRAHPERGSKRLQEALPFFLAGRRLPTRFLGTSSFSERGILTNSNTKHCELKNDQWQPRMRVYLG